VEIVHRHGSLAARSRPDVSTTHNHLSLVTLLPQRGPRVDVCLSQVERVRGSVVISDGRRRRHPGDWQATVLRHIVCCRRTSPFKKCSGPHAGHLVLATANDLGLI
jgi:hypothetical protein